MFLSKGREYGNSLYLTKERSWQKYPPKNLERLYYAYGKHLIVILLRNFAKNT